MAEFIELTETRGTWAVYVTVSGYGVCCDAFSHGTPHWHLHSRGINQQHAKLIATNWAKVGKTAMVDEKPCGCCSNGCACAEHSTSSVEQVKTECGLPHKE